MDVVKTLKSIETQAKQLKAYLEQVEVESGIVDPFEEDDETRDKYLKLLDRLDALDTILEALKGV